MATDREHPANTWPNEARQQARQTWGAPRPEPPQRWPASATGGSTARPPSNRASGSPPITTVHPGRRNGTATRAGRRLSIWFVIAALALAALLGALAAWERPQLSAANGELRSTPPSGIRFGGPPP